MAAILADLLWDLAAALWLPPERAIRGIWRRLEGRGRAGRGLAFVLTVLVLAVSFALFLGVLVLIALGVDALVRALV